MKGLFIINPSSGRQNFIDKILLNAMADCIGNFNAIRHCHSIFQKLLLKLLFRKSPAFSSVNHRLLYNFSYSLADEFHEKSAFIPLSTILFHSRL